MFIAALFTVAKSWKQSSPSTDDWIKKRLEKGLPQNQTVLLIKT